MEKSIVAQLPSIIRTLGLLALGVLLLVAMAVYSHVTLNDIVSAFLSLPLLVSLLFLALFLIQQLLLAWRWGSLVRLISHSTPFRLGYFYCVTNVSLFFQHLVVGAVAGPVYRSLTLRADYGITLTSGLWVIAIESAVSLMTLGVLALPLLWYLSGATDENLAISLGVILFAGLVASTYTRIGIFTHFTNMLRFLGRITTPILSRLRLTKKEASNGFKFTHQIDDRAIRATLLLSFLAYLITLVASWMILVAMEIEVPLLPFAILFPATYLVTIFSITPGGLGIEEVSLAGLLLFLDVDINQATQYIIIRRILYEVSALSLAGLSYLAYLSLYRTRQRGQ